MTINVEVQSKENRNLTNHQLHQLLKKFRIDQVMCLRHEWVINRPYR